MRYEQPATEDRAIWDIWLSMYRAPAMAAAEDIGIFTELAERPATAVVVAQRLALNRRATEIVLEMLCALGLLALRDARYELTDVARTYLLRASPHYWGPLLRTLGVVPQQHEALLAALRAPDALPPQTSASSGDTADGWQRGHIDRAQAEVVTQIMHCHSLPASVGVANNGDLEGVTRLLDVGGGSGCFAVAIAQRLPTIRCTVMELPAVCDVAQRYIAEGGVADRVDTVAVDMFRDAWPQGYDGMFFSNIFHDWDTETNRFLAQRAYDALSSGGRIFLHEMLLAEDGTGPVTTAAFSMLMLLGTRGRQYTLSALERILAHAGFRNIAARPSYGYYSVVSATKP